MARANGDSSRFSLDKQISLDATVVKTRRTGKRCLVYLSLRAKRSNPNVAAPIQYFMDRHVASLLAMTV